MAGSKYECRGFMIAPPKGHKKWGWLPFTDRWGPTANRQMKGSK